MLISNTAKCSNNFLIHTLLDIFDMNLLMSVEHNQV